MSFHPLFRYLCLLSPMFYVINLIYNAIFVEINKANDIVAESFASQAKSKNGFACQSMKGGTIETLILIG